MTQTDSILAHLEAGNRITPIEALSRFGCFRLGARIYDLRRDGHDISSKTKEVTTRDGKKHVAEYWINRRPS
jgi:hypothetical protein